MKVSNNYDTAKLWGTWNKNVSKSSEKKQMEINGFLEGEDC